MKRQRILNQEQPVAVFAGHRAAMTLIPVIDEIALTVLARDVRVNHDFAFRPERDQLPTGVDPFPTGSRETVEWRMDGVARALGRVIGHEQVDWHTVALVP